MTECTFAMLAGPSDAAFMGSTLRHLLKMCSFGFREVIVIADDLPKKGRSRDAVYRFHDILGPLRNDGTVTKCVFLSAVDRDRGILSRKYFGSPRIPKARDHRGVPLFGWLAGLEEAPTDFVVHFDSDSLLHQDPSYSWIDAAMRLMAQDSTVMFVSPLPGPPTSDGGLRGQSVDPIKDNLGNLRFKTFTSRRFLVSKQRFEKMLPTPVAYTSTKRRILMRLGFGNALSTWEDCVSRSLQESEYYRVHLGCPKAWALHCPDHGPDWLEALPSVIRRVEEGQYPAKQAGHFDLTLSAWC